MSPARLEPTAHDDRWLVVGGRGAGEYAAMRFAADGRVLSYELGGFVFKKVDGAN